MIYYFCISCLTICFYKTETTLSLPKFYIMGRRKRNLPFLENLEILDAGSEGKAVARYNERVVFIPFAVPGDIVNVQVIAKKKSYYEGKVLSFIKESPLRIQPECIHFGVCGGCKWQVLKYEDQLKFKQKQVEDALVRIGKIDISTINPIMGNSKAYYYRNKLEFTFSNKRWLEDFQKGEDFEERNMNGLGFHKPGMFDRVLDIQKCHLMDEPINDIRNSVKDFAIENSITFFDIRNQYGLLRNLIIRNTSIGDLMVIVVFYEDDLEKRNLLMNFLKDKFPKITSLVYIINSKPNDSISDQDFVIFDGNDHIVEEMVNLKGEKLKFKIGPKSFYQTNSKQAQNLYLKIAEYSDLQGNEVVYDLYTGTGTIANFVAGDAKKVIGIEYISEAIDDAKINSQINNISNTEFFAGDMAKVLNDEFVNTHGAADLIITDPPRAGMHQDVIDMLLKIKAKKIVYVSCNPATQARDLALLTDLYQVINLQPVDMFPQTAHVENIAVLSLKIND